MIVMLNTLEAPASLRTAALLAGRLDAGRTLELWGLSPADASRRAAALQGRGARHLVAPGVFLEASAMAATRAALGELDDEVYAFRVDLWADPLPDAEGGPSGLKAWREAVAREARRGDIGLALDLGGGAPAEAAAAIWDDLHEPVVLVEPDPGWPAAFVAERRLLTRALGTTALAVEHVGSTAVAGLPAKPIIDVLVTVKDLADAAGCVAPLAALGYAFADYPQNRDRRFFRKGKPRSHHIQIVARDSPAAQAYLRFRDALRQDAALREEYAALKRASQRDLAQRRAEYGARKTAMIERALAH